MKLSFSKRRDRRANERNKKNNPVKSQSLKALDLLEEHLLKYMAKQKKNKHAGAKAVPLEIVHLYTGIIVDGQKASRTSLKSAAELKAFDFIVAELEKTLAVFGASCQAYCNDYSTEAVPDVVIKQFARDLRLRINAPAHKSKIG